MTHLANSYLTSLIQLVGYYSLNMDALHFQIGSDESPNGISSQRQQMAALNLASSQDRSSQSQFEFNPQFRENQADLTQFMIRTPKQSIKNCLQLYLPKTPHQKYKQILTRQFQAQLNSVINHISCHSEMIQGVCQSQMLALLHLKRFCQEIVPQINFLAFRFEEDCKTLLTKLLFQCIYSKMIKLTSQSLRYQKLLQEGYGYIKKLLEGLNQKQTNLKQIVKILNQQYNQYVLAHNVNQAQHQNTQTLSSTEDLHTAKYTHMSRQSKNRHSKMEKYPHMTYVTYVKSKEKSMKQRLVSFDLQSIKLDFRFQRENNELIVYSNSSFRQVLQQLQINQNEFNSFQQINNQVKINTNNGDLQNNLAGYLQRHLKTPFIYKVKTNNHISYVSLQSISKIQTLEMFCYTTVWANSNSNFQRTEIEFGGLMEEISQAAFREDSQISIESDESQWSQQSQRPILDDLDYSQYYQNTLNQYQYLRRTTQT